MRNARISIPRVRDILACETERQRHLVGWTQTEGDCLAPGIHKQDRIQQRHANDGKRHNLQDYEARLLWTAFNLGWEESRQWPGIATYLHYMEGQVNEMWCNSPTPAIFSALRYPSPLCVHHGIEFIIAVADAFYTSKKSGVSINEISESVFAKYGVDLDSDAITSAIHHSCEQAIFAAIGWLSMLYMPVKASEHGFSMGLDNGEAGLKLSCAREGARRPITGFLRAFGSLLPCPQLKNAAGEQDIGFVSSE